MKRGIHILLAFSLTLAFGSRLAVASGSFICREPGGKRLIQIDDKSISKPGGKTLIYIDGDDLLLGNIHEKAFLVVDDHDVRPSPAGVVIANFDGDDIRHGRRSTGKVLINYRHPDLCPTSADNRIYSIEGDPLTKQQLVAGLYLLTPEMFKLSDDEIAKQQEEIKENAAEEARLAARDPMAGKWMVLNGHGAVEKTGSGTITIDPKKGDAYTLTFDHTKNEGPLWSGVGFFSKISGDNVFFTAYGTPKTVGLCVYEIKEDGTLAGKWYPWYLDGNPKNVGTENLKGPANLDGDFTIVSATAPATGAPYAGTVSIKPLEIVGAGDYAKPYSVNWTIGTYKVAGIGIRSGNFLVVASGTGADVNIARYVLQNGSMNSDWFKLGSMELGGAAATTQ